MKFFNTAGVVKAEDHYCLPPLSRINMEELSELIEMLMAFLQRIINGGGHIIREYALGRKRMDLGVFFGEQRFAIEIKNRQTDRQNHPGAGNVNSETERSRKKG